MEDEVLISIRGIQAPEAGPSADDEPIEVFVPGSYAYRDGMHVLEYDESFEGIEESAHNVVTFGDGKVEVHKTGGVDMDMYFEKGKTNQAYYATPYGTLVMAVSTIDVTTAQKKDRIDIGITYALSVNESLVSDCTLTITAVSKGAEPGLDFSN